MNPIVEASPGLGTALAAKSQWLAGAYRPAGPVRAAGTTNRRRRPGGAKAPQSLARSGDVDTQDELVAELNAIARVASSRSPDELTNALQRIEDLAERASGHQDLAFPARTVWASLLFQRYTLTEDESLIHQALAHLELPPSTDTSTSVRANYWITRGRVFYGRAVREPDVDVAREAEDSYRTALLEDLAPEQAEIVAAFSEDAARLGRIIRTAQRAPRARPAGAKETPAQLVWRAEARRLLEPGEDGYPLPERLDLLKDLVADASAAGAQELARCYGKIAQLLRLRYDYRGEIASLREGIVYARWAHDHGLEDPAAISEVGVLYRMLGMHLKNPGYLDYAVEVCRSAYEKVESTDPRWADITSDLAIALKRRRFHTGAIELADLDDAIALEELAAAADDSWRARSNLATSLLLRSAELGTRADLDRAEGLLEEVIHKSDEDFVIPGVVSLLGVYRLRSMRGEAPAYLDKARREVERALSTVSPDHYSVPELVASYATVVHLCAEGDDAVDLAEPVALLDQIAPHFLPEPQRALRLARVNLLLLMLRRATDPASSAALRHRVNEDARFLGMDDASLSHLREAADAADETLVAARATIDRLGRAPAESLSRSAATELARAFAVVREPTHLPLWRRVTQRLIDSARSEEEVGLSYVERLAFVKAAAGPNNPLPLEEEAAVEHYLTKQATERRSGPPSDTAADAALSFADWLLMTADSAEDRETSERQLLRAQTWASQLAESSVDPAVKAKAYFTLALAQKGLADHSAGVAALTAAERSLALGMVQLSLAGRKGAGAEIDHDLIRLEEDIADERAHLSHYRYLLTGEPGHLSAAIDHWHASGSADPFGLGQALFLRFEETGSLEDLRDAIAVFESGRDDSDEPPITYRNEHASALVALALADKSVTALDEASEQLDLAEREPGGGTQSERALTVMLKASLQLVRFQLLGDLEALRSATDMFRAALAPEAELPAHARPSATGSYASSLRALAQITSDPTAARALLTEARSRATEAAAAAPDNAALAMLAINTLQDRDLLTPSQELTDQLLHELRSLALRTENPQTRAEADFRRAELHARRGQVDEALSTFDDLLAAAATLAPVWLERTDRERLVDLACHAAQEAMGYAMNQGDLERALTYFELGRTALTAHGGDWQADLERLRQIAPEHAQTLEDQLSSAGNSPVADLLDAFEAPERAQRRSDRQSAAHQLQKLIGEARSALRDPGAFAPLSPATTYDGDGRCIVANLSSAGVDFVQLTRTGRAHLRIPIPHDEILRRIDSFEHLLRVSLCLTEPGVGDLAGETITDVVDWLWRMLVEPAFDHFGIEAPPPGSAPRTAAERVYWCASGQLSVIPWAVLGPRSDSGPAADGVLSRAVSSTISSITQFSRRATHGLPAAFNAMSVEMTETPDLPLGNLAHAAEEARAFREAFPGAVAYGTSTGRPATADEVLAGLANNDVVHVACHAVADAASSARSYLVLRDHSVRPLSALVLSGLPRRPRFLAFLGACSTSSPGGFAMDQSLTLVRAMQEIGYLNVVGTLWPVYDDASLQITRAFYAALDSPTDATGDVALALNRAISTLRDSRPDDIAYWGAHVHWSG